MYSTKNMKNYTRVCKTRLIEAYSMIYSISQP